MLNPGVVNLSPLIIFLRSLEFWTQTLFLLIGSLQTHLLDAGLKRLGVYGAAGSDEHPVCCPGTQPLPPVDLQLYWKLWALVLPISGQALVAELP